MDVLRNGKSILDDVDLKSAYYYDYAGGNADKIRMTMLNTDGIDFIKGDIISADLDNGSKTGDLYLSFVQKRGTDLVIEALSTKPSANDSCIFMKDNITLHEIARSVASELDLTLSMHNIKDYLYVHKEQIYDSNLNFLFRICELEGILLKINSGRLIMINEKEAENAVPESAFSETDFEQEPEFSTKDVNLLASVQNTWRHENMLFRRKIYSGLSGKHLYTRYMCGSLDECERICKGILRKHNKNEFTASAILKYGDLCAGQTINLTTWDSFSGRYFISGISNDLMTGNQKLICRKPIAGDY